MINAFFYKQKKKFIGFQIKGHAGLYKKLIYKIIKFFIKKYHFNKKDYICSAVSAVSYMAVIGLKQTGVPGIKFNVNESGFMDCQIYKADERSEIIFSMLYSTLEEIIKEYPGHIKIKVENSEE